MADITIKPTTGSPKIERSSRGTSTPAGKAASPAPVASDSVELTPLSTELRSMASNLNDAQVVDTGRIEAIKQAIRDGRFKVNAEAVADRLIATVQDLVEKKK